jgi:hypothetical protein
MKTRGVLYIAYGDLFVKEALFSAESVKAQCPDLEITMFSDRIVDSPFIDDCKVISVSHLRSKIDYMDQSPYDLTIFLDTDTVINHDITDMFEILETFDLVAAHDLARKRKKYSETIPEYGKIPYSFSEVNTGVLAYRKSEHTKRLFRRWQEFFYKNYHISPWDQPSFRVAAWEGCQRGLQMYIFPVEYNIRSKANREKQRRFHHEFGEDHLKPRIYHMHADSINQGKYDIESLEEIFDFCKQNFMEY